MKVRLGNASIRGRGYGGILLVWCGRWAGPVAQPGVWLVVLDGEQAHLGLRDDHGFRTVRTWASDSAGQRTAELVTDRLGRSFESAVVARKTIAPPGEPHAQWKERIAVQVAADLNTVAAQCLFARLILAGPSRTLRAVETALGPGVQCGITGRVAKNLVKVPDQGLAAHLPSWPQVL